MIKVICIFPFFIKKKKRIDTCAGCGRSKTPPTNEEGGDRFSSSSSWQSQTIRLDRLLLVASPSGLRLGEKNSGIPDGRQKRRANFDSFFYFLIFLPRHVPSRPVKKKRKSWRPSCWAKLRRAVNLTTRFIRQIALLHQVLVHFPLLFVLFPIRIPVPFAPSWEIEEGKIEKAKSAHPTQRFDVVHVILCLQGIFALVERDETATCRNQNGGKPQKRRFKFNICPAL
jgi:hypothetical protein